MNYRINTLNYLLCLLLVTFSATSCGEDGLFSFGNNFLRGTWVYGSGAEVYYDGLTAIAKGTKVPDNNIGSYIVGEIFWEDIEETSESTWSLNHIARYTNGTKIYLAATLTEVDDNTILLSTNGLEGILTRK